MDGQGNGPERVIAIRGLKKAFGSNEVLRGFDLELVASGVPMPAQDRQHTLRLPDSNRLGGSGR